MQKTQNSLNSFYQNETSMQKSYHISRMNAEKYNHNTFMSQYSNSSSVEPAYSVNAISLNKNCGSKTHQNRVSQKIIPIQGILSRESMNLTPQLQSPDVVNTSRNQSSSIIIHKTQKESVKLPYGSTSRNGKNLLMRSKMLSHSFFRSKGVSTIVPHSSVKISQTYLKGEC